MINPNANQQDDYYLTRVANLQKATQLKRDGFKSSIHALPQEVRTKLDELLTHKLSPVKALAALCDQYPKVELPSPKAVENYRNKYHKASLTKRITLVAKQEVELDLLRSELQKTSLEQMEYLSAKLLPKLVKRLDKALDQEEKIGMPLKIVNDSVLPVLSVIKVINDFIGRNNLHLLVEEKTKITEEPVRFDDTPHDPRALEVKLSEILAKNGSNLSLRPLMNQSV